MPALTHMDRCSFFVLTWSLRVWCCSSCDCVFLRAFLSSPRTRLVSTTVLRPQSMSTSLVSDIQSAINGGPPRTKDEADYFTSTLYNINMLYLGLQVARCPFVLLSVRCCFCSFCFLSLVIWRFSFERLNDVICRSSSSTTTSTNGRFWPCVECWSSYQGGDARGFEG